MNYVLIGILFVLELIFGAWYTTAGFPKVTLKAFFLKVTASAVFLANALIAYFAIGKGQYALTIVLALAFGLIGDAFLSLDPFFKGENAKKNNIIAMIIGAGFFLIGHILYIIAFIRETKLKGSFDIKLFLGIWVITIGIALIVKAAIKLKLGNFGFPVLAYALALSAMFSLATTLAIKGFSGQTLTQVMLIAASVMFVISDGSLGMKFFDKRFNNLPHRCITLSTYYLAQFLFGLTIYFVK